MPRALRSCASPSPSASGSTSPSPRRSPSCVQTTEAARPSNIASRLHTIPASTGQLIVVYSNGYGTSVASLETFERVDGVWRSKFGVVSARIGGKGFSDSHEEGVATTPTGVYSIGSTMYGVATPASSTSTTKLSPTTTGTRTRLAHVQQFRARHRPGRFQRGAAANRAPVQLFRGHQLQHPCEGSRPGPGQRHLPARGGERRDRRLRLVDTDQPPTGVLEWLDPAASPRIVMAPSQSLNRY